MKNKVIGIVEHCPFCSKKSYFKVDLEDKLKCPYCDQEFNLEKLTKKATTINIRIGHAYPQVEDNYLPMDKMLAETKKRGWGPSE